MLGVGNVLPRTTGPRQFELRNLERKSSAPREYDEHFSREGNHHGYLVSTDLGAHTAPPGLRSRTSCCDPVAQAGERKGLT